MAAVSRFCCLNIAVKSTSAFKNSPYYDPFYDAMRAFLRGEVTWEEVEQADAESRQAQDQHYAFLRLLEAGLRNPETFSQIRDLLFAVPLSMPSE